MSAWLAYVSLCGTGLGMCSRIPQIVRVVQRGSAADISARALAMNIAANMCFLTYASAHAQWPIALNNVVVILLDGTLIGLRARLGEMKKSASGSDLTLLSPDE